MSGSAYPVDSTSYNPLCVAGWLARSAMLRTALTAPRGLPTVHVKPPAPASVAFAWLIAHCGPPSSLPALRRQPDFLDALRARPPHPLGSVEPSG